MVLIILYELIVAYVQSLRDESIGNSIIRTTNKLSDIQFCPTCCATLDTIKKPSNRMFCPSCYTQVCFVCHCLVYSLDHFAVDQPCALYGDPDRRQKLWSDIGLSAIDYVVREIVTELHELVNNRYADEKEPENESLNRNRTLQVAPQVKELEALANTAAQSGNR